MCIVERIFRSSRFQHVEVVFVRFPCRLLAFCTVVALSYGNSSQLVLAITRAPEVKDMCKEEIRSICLRPWRRTPRALAACVEHNRSSLSLRCQEFWLTVHMCQEEVKELCGGLDTSTVQKCLSESGSELSGTCQKTLGID